MSKKESKVNKKLTYDQLEHYAKRILADFENYKKRVQKEKLEYSHYANTDLILQILPVLDNFKIAVRHLPPELKDNAWVSGIGHIENQLEQILKGEGLNEIPTTGQFDPQIHEAVEEVVSKKPPGEVVEEVRKGYTLNGKVIRHTKVKVASGHKHQATKEKSQN